MKNKIAPLQELELAEELDRLYMLHDRPLTANKKTILVEELAGSGLSFNAIIKGIRSLYDQNINKLSLFVLKTSARQFEQFEPDHAPECQHCSKTGFVFMFGKSYQVAVPCICDRGDDRAKYMKLNRWNGKRTMASRRFGDLKLVFPNPETVPEIEDSEYQQSKYWQE